MSPDPIRLQLLADALDADGQPRAGLLVPAAPAAFNRRPTLILFANVATAVAAKRALEAPRHG